jgi:hypothetical protein
MAEPEDHGARNRAHIPINAFRETAAYTFPVRNQSANRCGRIMPLMRQRCSNSLPSPWAIFRRRVSTRGCPSRA